MISKVYVIRHIAYEDLGSWYSILSLSQRYDVIKYFEAAYDDLSTIALDKPELLIILGGPIGVYDHVDYPFLLIEQAIIKDRITHGMPTLGICLGAQLIAAALGAKVYKGIQQEIGWTPINLTNTGKSNYFKHFSDPAVKLLHWHGDTFDLPHGAVLQASTALYPNQAFTIGNHVLALQFHPEVTESGMEQWFIGNSCQLSHTSEITISTLRKDTQAYAPLLQHPSQLFLQEWLSQFTIRKGY